MYHTLLYTLHTLHTTLHYTIPYTLQYTIIYLDEGHCIKNANSQRYTNLNYLKPNRRLLLSGTPVQNDIRELLALLSFLMPKTFTKSNCEILLESLINMGNSNSNSILQLRGRYVCMCVCV